MTVSTMPQPSRMPSHCRASGPRICTPTDCNDPPTRLSGPSISTIFCPTHIMMAIVIRMGSSTRNPVIKVETTPWFQIQRAARVMSEGFLMRLRPAWSVGGSWGCS